jgi:thiamine kinase-like enzyme
MTDPRFTWIKYFSSDQTKIIVVLPKGAKGPGLNTLKELWKDDLLPIIVQNGKCYSPFTPLPNSTIKNRNGEIEVIIYLIQNREPSKTINKKLILERQFPVVEYSIFPGLKNPRWFIPVWQSLSFGKMPRMIQPSSFIARTAVTMFRLLRFVKQTHFIFPCRLIVTHKMKNSVHHENYRSIINIFQENELRIKSGLVYTGSYGPLQKFTIELLQDKNNPFAYAKFGQNKYTSRAIKNEKIALKHLSVFQFDKIKVPELLELSNLPEEFSSQLLIVKTLQGGGPLKHTTKALNQGLLELYNATKKINSITVSSYIEKQIEILRKQNSHLDKKYEKMRYDLMSIMKNISTNINDSILLPLALSHGDFTRWNVRGDKERIYVIDWEEARMRPLGHDLLSFLLAEYLLVHQIAPEKAVPRIVEEIINGMFDKFLNKIRSSDSSLDINSILNGILFFIEIFNSTLWHARMHTQHQYPQKQSLGHFLETAWQGCTQLIKLYPHKTKNRFKDVPKI